MTKQDDRKTITVEYVPAPPERERLDAELEADPIAVARKWLDGYAHRLETAERSRHKPEGGIDDGAYRKALAWAHDPMRDAQSEAFDRIADRLGDTHAMTEHLRTLWAIPHAQRVSQRFIEKLGAWLDRVELELSVAEQQEGISLHGQRFDAAWISGATRGNLRHDMLKQARTNGKLPSAEKNGARWEYDLREVVSVSGWSKYRVYFVKALEKMES